MPRRRSFPLLDGVVFAVTVSGLAFVPSTTIPQPLWAAGFGAYNLAVYLIQLTRLHDLQAADVGRLLGGAVFVTAAGAIALGVTRPLALLAVMFGAIILTGLAWSAAKASFGQPKIPKE